MRILALAYLALSVPGSLAAQASPYVRLERREVKALSAEEIAARVPSHPRRSRQ